MKIFENGVCREPTTEELLLLNRDKPALSYNDRVVSRIREIYSVDDELAILRQRDTKPEEFAEYNTFVESVKEQERAVE